MHPKGYDTMSIVSLHEDNAGFLVLYDEARDQAWLEIEKVWPLTPGVTDFRAHAQCIVAGDTADWNPEAIDTPNLSSVLRGECIAEYDSETDTVEILHRPGTAARLFLGADAPEED